MLAFLRNGGQTLARGRCKEAARGGLAAGSGSLRTAFLQLGVEIQTPVTAVEGAFGFLGLDEQKWQLRCLRGMPRLYLGILHLFAQVSKASFYFGEGSCCGSSALQAFSPFVFHAAFSFKWAWCFVSCKESLSLLMQDCRATSLLVMPFRMAPFILIVSLKIFPFT